MKARNTLMLRLLVLSALVGAVALPAGATDRSSWTRVAQSEACIGGTKCGYNAGDALHIPLSGASIEAVRFFAHDNVGRHHTGRLRVAIDGYELTRPIRPTRRGRSYEIDAGGARGDYLVFTALSNDEIVLDDIEVLYRSDGTRGVAHKPLTGPYGPSRDRWHALDVGGCFGGHQCGSNGYALEAHLADAPLYGLRFYAHDDVAGIRNGRIRVLVDGSVIEPDLEISDTGAWYEIPIRGLRGRYVVFETIADDEVVIERVEVLYGRSKRRLRW